MDRCFDLRLLRRRMGWTSSDLARRLGVPSADIEIWEKGNSKPEESEVVTRIEFLFRQADICCDEVRSIPMAENFLEESHLGQVEVGRIEVGRIEARRVRERT